MPPFHFRLQIRNLVLTTALSVIMGAIDRYAMLVPAKRIKNLTTGKAYKIRQSLACRTHYVIYCALVHFVTDNCRFFLQFQIRLSSHKSHIKKNIRTCRLVNHFIDNSCSHTLPDLKIILIEQVATKTEKFLWHRKGHWQAQLWTYEPYGFNA